MAKEPQDLAWIAELIPKNAIRKPMFGGFAYYLDSKLILVLFESLGDFTYKSKKYDFELWNGCMFPADYEQHESIKKKYPFLINHPVLGKWFYLPLQTENFEELVRDLCKEFKKSTCLFGTYPKIKKKNTVKTKKIEKSKIKINMKCPQMFSDEPITEKLQKAKSISDLKNLGPSSEKAFTKAGIKSAAQFVKMGWKKAMVALVKSNPKNRHSLFAYALIGALKNIEWHAISEEDKKEAREFSASLKKSKK